MHIYDKKESAVSPVIGILLMLVVTIIIAAVVSGFAGGLMTGQEKVPTAQITGKLSISDGFTIKHNGGDSISTKDMVITIKNSRLFGPDVEERTVQVISKRNVTDSSGGKFWEYIDGSSDVTSFNSGDTALISSTNCSCNNLQPIIAPNDFATKISPDGMTYSGGKGALWALCAKNPANVGKTIIMEVADKATGKLISRADIPITS